MNRYFTVKLKCFFQAEGGEPSRKTITFFINAMTWGEAEEKMFLFTKINRAYGGEMEITSIIPSKVNELFVGNGAGKFFMAKCRYHEESANGKPMIRSHSFLVEAEDLKEAEANLMDGIRDSMIDYTATDLKETQIFEIIDLKTVEKEATENKMANAEAQPLFETEEETDIDD